MSVLSVGAPRGAWGQLSRFLAVGVVNTAVSVIAYRLLLRVGAHYLPAGAAAFAAGAVNGYVLNRRLTFGVGGSIRSCVTYVGVQAAGLALATGLLWLLVDTRDVGHLAAQALVIPPVTLITFALNRYVTFATYGL